MPTATRHSPDGTGAGARKPPPTPLASYLREALERHGYQNHALFARRARISDQYLRNLLAGYHPDGETVVEPSWRVMRRLAEALAQEPPTGELQVELEYANLLRAAGVAPNLVEGLPPEVLAQWKADPTCAQVPPEIARIAAADQRRRQQRERLLADIRANMRRVEQILLEEGSTTVDQMDDPPPPPN